MICLVTGAGGFAGRHLVALLAAEGEQALGVGRPGNGPGLIPLELTDGPAVAALLREVRPERIYHLAADSSPRASLDRPVETIANNLGSTAAVLYGAAELEPMPRVLVVTSSEIYGAPDLPAPLTEVQPPAPTTPYAFSKLASSALARHLHETRGLPVIEARPFNHIGPGQARGFVVPDFASQIAEIAAGRAKPRLRVGDLSARKDFTDVRDIVRGYVSLAERGRPGEIYHLCSGSGTAVRELLATLLELSGLQVQVELDQKLANAGRTPTVVGCSDKIRHELGWEPRIGLRQTLDDVLAEWRERITP